MEKTGSDQHEKAPASTIFLKPGYGESGKTFKKFRNELAHLGHETVVAEHPKPKSRKEVKALILEASAFARGWYKEHRPDIPQEHLDALLASIPPTLFEEALSLIEAVVAHSSPDNPKKMVGHSQGGPAAVYAAFLRPDLFMPTEQGQSSILLMNPAGLTGKREIKHSKELAASGKVWQSRVQAGFEMFGDSARTLGIMVRYMAATVGTFITSIHNPAIRSAFWGWLKHVSHHELRLSMRIVNEASDMANTDILPFLDVVTGNGVLVQVMQDKDDSLFRSRIIGKRILGKKNITIHTTAGGGHYMPLKMPRAAAEVVHGFFS